MGRCTTALLQLSWQLSGSGAPQAELQDDDLRRPAAQAPCLDSLPSRRRRGIAALELRVRWSWPPRKPAAVTTYRVLLPARSDNVTSKCRMA